MKLPDPLSSLSPLPLADFLFHKNKRVETYIAADTNQRADLYRRATSTVRREILSKITDKDIALLIESLSPDEATSLLRLLPNFRREKILRSLADSVKSSLSTLLAFDPQTAAGLMTLDYIQVESYHTVEDVAHIFKLHESHTGRPPVILVMEHGKLTGFLPGYALGIADKHDHIQDLIKHMPTISYAASHKQVVDTFRAHPHGKVAVVTADHKVLGIIYSSEVLKLLGDNTASSLYDFAGVSEEENVTDSARRIVAYRYKWLIINLATAFLAAFTVSQFEAIISEYVLLAVYMPIVAGMGGNAATQTLAVLVRGIALKQITLGTAWRTLRNEMLAGTANGIINGLIVAFVVILKDNNPAIALVLALAMVVNLIVASSFGTLVPLIMAKLKKDPAASATIFITTATDVLGFLAFLGLATLILQ